MQMPLCFLAVPAHRHGQGMMVANQARSRQQDWEMDKEDMMLVEAAACKA